MQLNSERVVLKITAVACLIAALASCSANPKQKASSAPAETRTAVRAPEPYSVDDEGHALPALMVHLAREMYGATVHEDYAQLTRLLDQYCAGPSMAPYRSAQIRSWHQPGVLHEMAMLLMTHAAPTDGFTYPGFSLAGFQTKYDYDDAALLHVRAPSVPTMHPTYRGNTIIFGYGWPPAKQPSWCGMGRNY